MAPVQSVYQNSTGISAAEIRPAPSCHCLDSPRRLGSGIVSEVGGVRDLAAAADVRLVRGGGLTPAAQNVVAKPVGQPLFVPPAPYCRSAVATRVAWKCCAVVAVLLLRPRIFFCARITPAIRRLLSILLSRISRLHGAGASHRCAASPARPMVAGAAAVAAAPHPNHFPNRSSPHWWPPVAAHGSTSTLWSGSRRSWTMAG